MTGLPRDPDPGYRAILKQHLRTIEVYAATAEELRAEVADADADDPPDEYGR